MILERSSVFLDPPEEATDVSIASRRLATDHVPATCMTVSGTRK
jgi:hypothetical protein